MTRHHHRISALPTALLLALLLSLSACGLGDSGSAAVTAAKLKAHEAEGARATKEQLERQLADSQEQAAQRQKEIEAATR
jgi:outer membrane lipopolysaccharide assembly protein LptE/RlpB